VLVNFPRIKPNIKEAGPWRAGGPTKLPTSIPATDGQADCRVVQQARVLGGLLERFGHAENLTLALWTEREGSPAGLPASHRGVGQRPGPAPLRAVKLPDAEESPVTPITEPVIKTEAARGAVSDETHDVADTNQPCGRSEARNRMRPSVGWEKRAEGESLHVSCGRESLVPHRRYRVF
jgi:hypothetical protein